MHAVFYKLILKQQCSEYPVLNRGNTNIIYTVLSYSTFKAVPLDVYVYVYKRTALSV